MDIILASKSPRRREILEMLGVNFRVLVADADESSDICDPIALVCELARRKGRAVYDRLSEEEKENALIIACDTLVFADGEVLGKPRDRKDAERMIRLLSGRSHKVISGLYLRYNGKEVSAAEPTNVIFDNMTDEEIEAYISIDEPYDKAGAYAVQGRASVYISGIEGDYFNVMGLPANLLFKTLKREFGIKLC